MSDTADSHGDKLDFSNHDIVFRHKTFWELLRGLFVLHICGIDFLVKHSYKVSDSSSLNSMLLF